MHASKPTPAPIVKCNRFENFQCFRNRYEIDQMNMVSYASAVGSLMSTSTSKNLPDVVYVSEIFCQKSSPDIDNLNRVDNVL